MTRGIARPKPPRKEPAELSESSVDESFEEEETNDTLTQPDTGDEFSQERNTLRMDMSGATKQRPKTKLKSLPPPLPEMDSEMPQKAPPTKTPKAVKPKIKAAPAAAAGSARAPATDAVPHKKNKRWADSERIALLKQAYKDRVAHRMHSTIKTKKFKENANDRLFDAVAAVSTGGRARKEVTKQLSDYTSRTGIWNDYLISKYGDENGVIIPGSIDPKDRLDYPQRLALRYLEVENVAGFKRKQTAGDSDSHQSTASVASTTSASTSINRDVFMNAEPEDDEEMDTENNENDPQYIHATSTPQRPKILLKRQQRMPQTLKAPSKDSVINDETELTENTAVGEQPSFPNFIPQKEVKVEENITPVLKIITTAMVHSIDDASIPTSEAFNSGLEETRATSPDINPNPSSTADNGTQVGRSESRVGDHLQRLLEVTIDNQTHIIQSLYQMTKVVTTLTRKIMVSEKDTQTDVIAETPVIIGTCQTDVIDLSQKYMQTDDVMLSVSSIQTEVIDLTTFTQQTTPLKLHNYSSQTSPQFQPQEVVVDIKESSVETTVVASENKENDVEPKDAAITHSVNTDDENNSQINEANVSLEHILNTPSKNNSGIHTPDLAAGDHNTKSPSKKMTPQNNPDLAEAQPEMKTPSPKKNQNNTEDCPEVFGEVPSPKTPSSRKSPRITNTKGSKSSTPKPKNTKKSPTKRQREATEANNAQRILDMDLIESVQSEGEDIEDALENYEEEVEEVDEPKPKRGRRMGVRARGRGATRQSSRPKIKKN